MANIQPFNGYRFNARLNAEMGKLIAPPYDVIDPALRDTLWRLSEYNIARVTKADRNEKSATGNPYEAAGALWRQWLAQDIVQRDAQPAIYVYEQHFNVHGRTFSRTAMIVRLELQQPGKGVLPHENTLAGPKADRLELMRATATQFGQVFGLYPDTEGKVDAILDRAKTGHPIVNAADTQDLLHRLWAITDAKAIAELQGLMAAKDILIADGHHRYETSLAYMAQHPEMEKARFRMMAMVNMSNPGLVILPIHRLVSRVPNFKPATFLAALKKNFEIKVYPGETATVRDAVTAAMAAQQADGKHSFALYMHDGNHYGLSLRDERVMDRLQGHSESWRHLDVTILHNLILDQLMGITQERLAAESNIEYVQDVPHAVDTAARKVTDGQAQALFLMNATRVEEVQAVAQNRERMPQKSTFFFPKMYSGLVFYRLDE